MPARSIASQIRIDREDTISKAHILTSVEEFSEKKDRPVVLTIGTFDGVHLAHQELMREAIKEATKLQGITVALTFQNHPRAIVSPDHCPPLLTDWETKARLILSFGIDYVIGLRFNKAFSQTPAEKFISDTIVKAVRAEVVISGPNFHFGKGGKGSPDLLTELSTEYGYVYIRKQPVLYHGEKVSSTRIREDLKIGNVELASELLTRAHTIKGRVVTGDRIGRTIGFPTANMKFDDPTLLPMDGVYAVVVTHQKKQYDGMMNLGFRPTVDGREHRAEVHLLDFEADLVGNDLEISFIKRIRGEKRFASLEHLQEQLTEDREETIKILR